MFIETLEGDAVNANQIVRVIEVERRTETGKPYHELIAIGRDGQRWRTWQAQVDALTRAGSVIPSRPGDMAVLVSVSDDGSTYISDVPIVGWRVHGREGALYGEPVVADVVTENVSVAILLPDGRVLVQHDGEYPSRQAFADYLAEQKMKRIAYLKSKEAA